MSKNFDMTLSHSNLAPKPLSDIAPSKAFAPFNGGGANLYMKKVWKDIDGFKGLYLISNLGEIKSLSRIVLSRKRKTGNNFRTIKERIIPPEITRNGYCRISLSSNGINKRFLLHRLVAFNFIGNPENKPCVNHKDGNKLNNSVKNLEWVTYSENETHSFKILGKKIVISQKTKDKLSLLKKGVPLSESHKLKLRKPKSKYEKHNRK